MRIALTGSTGTIGGATLKSLIAHGHEVSCIVRNLAKAQDLVSKYGEKVHLIELESSLDPETQFYNAVRGYPNIIHSGFGGDTFEFDAVRGMIKAANEVAVTEHVNFVITTGGYAEFETFEIEGGDETNNQEFYEFFKGRRALEKFVLDSKSDNLFPSVVRPAAVYPGNALNQWLRGCKNLGKIVVPRSNGYIDFIHEDDLADIYRLIVEKNVSGIFHGVEGDGLSLEENIELAKTITGVQDVDRVENFWWHFEGYGFYLIALSTHVIVDRAKIQREREILGFSPKHYFKTEVYNLVKID